MVVRFQPAKQKLVKKQTDAKMIEESEKYFVDQGAVLEEKRMNQQMQLEHRGLKLKRLPEKLTCSFNEI